MKTNRPWIIDISGWNNPAPNYRKLVEQGCSGVVIKSSMGGGISTVAERQAHECRNAGMKYIGIYHWVDPIHRTPDSQLRHIEQMVSRIKPDFIASDNEQWWASWGAWHQMNRGEISAAAVPRLDPLHISNFGRRITRRIVEIFQLPVLNYTAEWFISKWSPPMRTWINEFDLWFAIYPINRGRWKTWEEFYSFVNNATPPLPRGATQWKFWQFTDKRYLPDMPARFLNLNLFNGSHADLASWIGQKEPTPVPEPPKEEAYFENYRVKTALGMRIRSSPGGRDTGKRLRFREAFRVYEKIVRPPRTWGRIHPTEDQFVALDWSERIA